jgi:PEP-CTERM motif
MRMSDVGLAVIEDLDVMKTFRTACLAAALIASLPSMAATINYGGVPANGGGFTTALTGPGVTTETFNGTTGNCGVTTGITVTGNYHLVTGSQVGYYAAPAGDTTCYLSIPQNGSNGTATVAPLSLITPNKKLTYFGLYWGSIDNYNLIEFYNNNTLVTTVTGAQALAANAVPGNQASGGSNRYVNIYFSPNEIVNKIKFVSNGVAFELDNVAFQTVATPEPASLALFGGALLAGAAMRRRRRKLT